MEKLLRAIVFVFSACLFTPVFAQSDSIQSTGHPTQTFSADTLIINKIIIDGNRVTKPQVILRELIFSEGDTLSKEDFNTRISLSRGYLINLFIFNDILIEPEPAGDGLTNVVIHVFEKRFYLVPLPVFELADRNFNQWWLSKDFSRTNFGFYLTYNNVRGRNETLKFNIIQGYTRKYELSYFIPFINRKQTLGIGFNFGLTKNREIWFETRENKIRFYEGKEDFMFRKFHTGLTLNLRSHILKTNRIDMWYNQISIGDTIATKLNPDFLQSGTQQDEITIKYTHINDHRTQKGYPLEGYYYKIEASNTVINFTDTKNLLTLQGTYRKYNKLAHRLYSAYSLNAKLSTPSIQPYNNFKALGYDYFVRGYELFVVDGQHYGLVRSAIKYALIPSRFYRIKLGQHWQTQELFANYINLFMDAGYVRNNFTRPDNDMPNSLLLGYGAGINLVFSHNNVVRIEYTSNKSGNRGVFLHFVYAI